MKRIWRAACRSLLRTWARFGIAHGIYYRVVEKCGARLAEAQPLATRLPDGSTMRCDLRDHVQRQIFFHGAYEPIESYLFTRLVRPGSLVIDAGANVGQYTLLASRAAGERGSVHAFEPVPENFERLRHHVRENCDTHVRVNRAALWHDETELSLGLPCDNAANAGSFSIGGESRVITARGMRLDDYIREQQVNRVDLIKIDIEGAEWFALRGAEKTLTRFRPAILAEVNRAACMRLGYDPEELWTLLVTRHGYTAWRIGHSSDEWRIIVNADALTQENVLFAPAELPAEVATGWNVRRCLRWARSGMWRRGTP